MFMWKLKNFLFRLTHPSFWIQVGETDWEWDKELNTLLDTNTIRRVSFGTSRVGEVFVWTENYPFGYGNKRDIYSFFDVSGLPAPLTRKRMHSMLMGLHKE